MSDDHERPRDPLRIIDPSREPRKPVNGKEIKIGWRGETPVVEHLTGTEAKQALVAVLTQSRQLGIAAQEADKQRAQLANILIALCYRDCARGLVGPDGRPVLPMRTAIPKEAVVVFRERWSFKVDPQPDGSWEIVCDLLSSPS